MRGDTAIVDDFLGQIDDLSLPPEFASPIVELLIAREQWVRAAGLYGSVTKPPPRLQVQQIFLRNMAAMAQHRPALAQMLARVPTNHGWVVDATGRVGRHDSGGLFVPLHADPDARLRRDLETALEALRLYRPLLFLGIGDGYSLVDLATRDLHLPHGMQQIILVIEPDLGLLRTILSIHDFSGPDGILVQSRGHWYVGDEWDRDLRRELIEEAKVSLPDTAILHPVLQTHLDRLHNVRDDYVQALVDQFQANRQWLRERSDEEMLDSFASVPKQPPRVLFLTSRFTTVLKYSTQRCAQAFRALGWQTEVMIESRDDERCTSLAIARELEVFRPHLVVVLNHLRREHGSLFPPELPYVSWVQDSMPALQSHDAAASVGPREVVMTGLSSFSRVYGYPRQQLFRCQCLAHERAVDANVAVPSHDILYLSHASMSLDDLRARVQASANHYKLEWSRAEPFFDELVEHYRADRSFSAMDEWGATVRQRVGLADDDYVHGHEWIEVFSFAYCTLHRQQGLRWAVNYARERGADAAIYGNGWQALPEFAAYAKGAVASGPLADALMAAAKVNLCLEPWPVTAHWRGLDCMVLGAFFLVRAHDYHQSVQDFVDFLTMHGYGHHLRDDPSWQEEEARRDLPAQLHYRFNELVYMTSKLGLLGDTLALARRLGVTAGGRALTPPRVDEVHFSTSSQLAQRLDRFLQAPAQRRELAEHFHRFAHNHLTYREGMRQVIAFMGERLAADLQSSRVAAKNDRQKFAA